MMQELKLNLIQWILEIQNQEVLERLAEWKEQEKKRKEERFLASFGAWQEDEDSDLMEVIYGSRYFEDRERTYLVV